MNPQPSYDFQKEWESLKQEMLTVRSRLAEVHTDSSVLSDTIHLLNRMGEQQQKLERKLDKMPS
jgi:hypothetical protein